MKTLYHPQKEDISLANVLYALGDPLRLQIAKALSQSIEESCGGLGLDALKSTQSYHFKVLREAGVIHTRVEGTQRFMSLRRAELEELFPGLLDAILKATPGSSFQELLSEAV